VVGDVTKWYQSHGFKTKPGWARIVEVEKKKGFRKELLSKWTNFKFRSHGFNIEPRWATNLEFIVKITENSDVESARRALREHWDCVWNHKRYNGLRNGHRERNHKFMVLGHMIYSEEGGPFTTVRSIEKCRRVNLEVLRNSQLRQSLWVIRENGSRPEVLKSRGGSTP
jgi:hypothetical protein